MNAKIWWYLIAFFISAAFGLLTFNYAKVYPEDYIGILSSIALCIICLIRIFTVGEEE
jgi:hypothetical protein